MAAALAAMAAAGPGAGPGLASQAGTEASAAADNSEQSRWATSSPELEATQSSQRAQTPDAAAPPVEANAPEPVRLRIPSIDVDAHIGPLAIRPDRTIDVPADADDTGWWADGPEPGEAGPAVILGHVDSRTGPAVFFRLDELRSGDVIHVDRIDGSSVVYRIERVERHAKDRFPTDDVYGPTDDSVLRLVTCGGDFDRSTRHYLDNVIAFATFVDVVPPRFTTGLAR